ncbi:PD-(D/E)XK nuclease family protein [Paenibacillus anseongense]|uniref:PD-(D/E)XK nuclease family protein n=1 Tax=Paenibacillus anseongense TaxID=2682845 RepID=UPI002DB57489|nr:PD-(D/E)XK nuclease family protein [Paenibacillus anseongense]MEC0269726.1 PD-(D/E)XK nuclease family protein [Paenibacillus anseongense]
MPSMFIQNLHESFQKSPLSKKILLAPRFADGQQWLHQVCKMYGHVLNVEVQTIESLALKQAALKLFQQKKTYIRSGQSFWLVQQIMMDLTKEDNNYLSEANLSPGMVSCFHRTIEDLRQTLVLAKELDPTHFVEQNKGQYVKAVLQRYEEKLHKHNFIDFMHLAEIVVENVDDTVFVMPGNNLLSKAQRTILEKITGNRLIRVDFSLPFSSDESDFLASKAAFFHATGAMAEVREVMRRILSNDATFDQVEIITSNYEIYAGAIQGLASELAIPCTFSSGLPLQYCRMGRTLLKLLHWIENDFPIADFLDLLREGGISFRNVDEGVRTSEWIRTIEALNIGWGKDRYFILFDEDESEQEKSLLMKLKKVFSDLISGLPKESECSPYLVVKWLQQVMKMYGAIQDEDDVLVLKELEGMVDTLSIEGLSSSLMRKDVALQYVKQLLSGIRVKTTSTPSSGAIHISALSNGGLSGRPFTYIVGMDEHSWSIIPRQDPVLLDEERQNVSPDLILSTERSRLLKKEQLTRLGAITGNATLSYSSYKISEGKHSSPAFEYLQIFRNKTQLQDSDYSFLQGALSMPEGYLSHALPLDASDIWAREMLDQHGRMLNGRKVLEASYPFLQKGIHAVRQRISNSITVYDGRIKSESLASDVRKRAFSASQLERYSECPMRYYFGYVLGIWPKNETAYDRTRWLDPANRGNLLHRIFYNYLKRVTSNGSQRPDHDKHVLHVITDEELEHYKRLIPAPSQHILQKESDDIRQDVEWFYYEEATKATLPRYFEQELSIDGEPMLVKLTDDSFITLKGFIDRIDQTAPNQYRIIDYKTGSPSKYRENEYFTGGTQLQHALYALAAEQWLKETGIDKDALVTESAYYFPTARGIGREVVRLQNKRDELSHLVRSLLTSMEQGIYTPTHETSRCRYCDFASVCGNHAEFMEGKKANPKNATLLKELLEVEAID